LGEATVLATSWNPLFPLSRALRDRGISVVGPGARPYKRGRLFALLAEQLCGSIVDPRPGSLGAIERSLFFLVQEITGQPRFNIFSYAGRVTALRLLTIARTHADAGVGALQWLYDCSSEIGTTLVDLDYIAPSQASLLYTSVQEMKADMRRNKLDTANYSIEDLGLFASPDRALKLSTLH
jgi:DNA helicase-2/ATP-dependent DNA helicase PcrA